MSPSKVAIYRGSQRPGRRASRMARPLREGQVRCAECGSGVRLREDGTVRGHRVDGYPCLGSGTDRYLDGSAATP